MSSFNPLTDSLCASGDMLFLAGLTYPSGEQLVYWLIWIE